MERSMNRVVMVIALAALRAPALAGQGALPFTDSQWVLSGDSTRIETVAGRFAVRMYNGSATRRDVQLKDGTIDVDVMTTRRRSFIYARFRMEDEGNSEEFYLRPHKSELPDAVQYAPVFRGQSAWQLYHGPRGTAAPAIDPGVWTRLRIVISGSRAAFFLGDTVTPTLVVRLAREPRAGYVSLASFLPANTPGSGPIAWFSNVRVRPGAIDYSFRDAPDPPLPAGVVTRWTVGRAFVPTTLEPTAIDSTWTAGMQTVTTEPNGMVEMNRWIAMPAGLERSATGDVGAVARVHITAEQAGIRRVQLGFSDAVTVFLNGRPLFHGDDSYQFLQRRDGLIAFDQATLFLPLKAGSNELAVVVTDHFGGWGLMARFPEGSGLTAKP
jgi:hypothetical protein